MPQQIGDTKTINGVTGQWDGQTWRQVDTPASQPETPGFWESLGQTVNPAHQLEGLWQTLSHPQDAAIAKARFSQEHPVQAALQAGFSPLTGGAGLEAGARIGSGDVRGGLGQAVGDLLNAASPALIPGAAEAVNAAPGAAIRGVGRGVTRAGRGMEAVGTAAGASKVAGVGMPGLGILEALFGSHPISGAALAVAPKLLEKAGPAVQRAGQAIERFATPEAANRPSLASLSGPYETEQLYKDAQQAGFSDVAARKGAGMRPPTPPPAPTPASAPPWQPQPPASDVTGPLQESMRGQMRDTMEADPQLQRIQAALSSGGQGLDEAAIPAMTSEGSSTGRPGELPPPGVTISELEQRLSRSLGPEFRYTDPGVAQQEPSLSWGAPASPAPTPALSEEIPPSLSDFIDEMAKTPEPRQPGRTYIKKADRAAMLARHPNTTLPWNGRR